MEYLGDITWDDYQASREFVETKALQMMQHRKKNMVKAGFPIQDYTILAIGDRRFYVIKSRVFKVLVDSYIIECCEQYPGNFGTKNADDIIDAFYQHEAVGTRETFPSFLQDEQFCYIIENKNGQFGNILRIDLFGKIFKTEKSTEFIGGLCHALKHFGYKGKPLSTHPGGTDIININSLLAQIATAFFTIPFIHEQKRNYLIYYPVDEDYQLRISIYYEIETDMYYLNTVFKERIKKKKKNTVKEKDTEV